MNRLACCLLAIASTLVVGCVGEAPVDGGKDTGRADTAGTTDTGGGESDTDERDGAGRDSLEPWDTQQLDSQGRDTANPPADTGEPEVPPQGNICERGPSSIPITSVLDALSEAACLYMERCGSPMPLMLGAPTLSLDSCRPAFFRSIEIDPNIVASIVEDAVIYDAEAAAECVLSFCNLSECSLLEFEPNSPACERVFRGTVGLGEACYGDMECTAGGCSSASCPGMCEADGGDCGLCPEGEYCDYNQSACRPWLATGATCQGAWEGCPPGTYCAPVPGNNVPLCAPLAGLGEPCYSSQGCVDTAYCASNAPGGPTCAPRAGVGGPCESDLQCTIGLRCAEFGSQTGTCVQPVFDLDPGAACVPMIDGCRWPSTCASGANQQFNCVEPKPAGEACALFIECQGFCNPVTALCENRLPSGSVCENSAQCLGFCAPDGRCHDTKLVATTACDGDRQCFSNICDYSGGGNYGVCTPPCRR